ncbi:MAG: NifB/NifX family molybdenum-iron cluster-binding protein [Minisyncoccales bacterium]
MKICITTTSKNKNSNVDPRFGRSQYFLILNEKGEVEEAIDNAAQNAQRGAGISAAQKLENKDVEILITGNIGPNAFNALNAAKIKVFLVDPSLTAEKAFAKWKDNELDEINKANVGGHFGRGGGPGRGRGKGWGPNN